MSLRLNMVDAKCNYRGMYTDTTCAVCDKEETTEHLLECDYYRQFNGENMGKYVSRNELYEQNC